MIGLREDPYANFRFVVEIEGLILAGFSKVSGLSSRMEFDLLEEGGVNYEYKLPSKVTYGDIVLERGVVGVDFVFHGWISEMMKGNCIRRSGSIMLLNRFFLPIAMWSFIDAFPISWEAGDFDAIDGTILMETMVLAHHGIEKVFGLPNIPI